MNIRCTLHPARECDGCNECQEDEDLDAVDIELDRQLWIEECREDARWRPYEGA